MRPRANAAAGCGCADQASVVTMTASTSGMPSTTVYSPYFSYSTPSSSIVDSPTSSPGPRTSMAYRLNKAKPQLIQDEIADDWFQLLVVTTLLNKASGVLAIPIFREIIRLWPTPSLMANAPMQRLQEMLNPLGLSATRAERLVSLSQEYLLDPPTSDKMRRSRIPNYPGTPISHLPGAGRYALDSWRIFCGPADEWQHVNPTDKPLRKYLVCQIGLIIQEASFSSEVPL
ncbi:hypothetical protein SISSUDRAFT_14892 [Sistotremastrum suecicum HHB10207 ss-3]|uniref:HhH-GPD domain-containing protein n=1 Tax=Sistotremastrum suecicum HHB10207 ss-3 TaxID=1314776 RepID=A0A166J631_9AGAM|nr:hypothetical protein SISSUDRAFT_14892 [Sistotremastrum suecicum HHB10207 ss-3]